MKKLNVLVSAFACHPSGQWHPGEDIVGWNLVKQLCRFHNIWVISHSYNNQSTEKTDDLPGAKFHFIHLPSWMNFLYKLEIGQRIYYYFWQILALRVAKRLYRDIHFDAAHHITFNNDWMPSFIGAYLPVPFIWGPVGGGQRTPKEFFREYSINAKMSEIIRDIGQWLGRNVLSSRRKCLKKAKAILICNDETKAKLSKKYTNKIYQFPVNGISRNDFTFDSEGDRNYETFTVMSTGRLIHWKAFHIAIESFYKFHKKFPESRLIVIGKGPEEDRLKGLAKKLEIEPNIQFIPWLPRNEWLHELRSCDVFLYPSLREGGGAVIVEAMASGKPVVCLDTAGPRFHVREEWGIKIKPKNPDYVTNEMAKSLEKLYLDQDLRMRLGIAARERIGEYYLWDQLGELLHRIYIETLS